MKKTGFLAGLTGVAASLLVISSVGSGIANKWRSNIDAALGTESYRAVSDPGSSRFKSDYATTADYVKASKRLSEREGEEGTVILKNDNGALPLKDKTKKIALFGNAAYKPYMQSAGDLRAGNADKVDLDSAFEKAGYTLEPTLKGIYGKMLSSDYATTRSFFGNTTTTYWFGLQASPGDMTNYKINELPTTAWQENIDLSKYDEKNTGTVKLADEGWEKNIVKDETIGVVVFGRGAGESNTYKPGSALNWKGEATGKDPLELSDDELQIVDKAKATCSKVIVLLNTGNAMNIGAIAKGGAHEVDAIAYMGVLNDYQATGIVNVLTGKVNATGALSDTYAKNWESLPAMQNFGGAEYADASIAERVAGTDSEDTTRWPGVSIQNGQNSSFGGGRANYSGASYYVEAEGIYIGYQYYETRYFDSVANSSFKANSTKGSTNGGAWKYSDEVIYPFGYGLSYLPYTQEIKELKVDKVNGGDITATITIHNNGNEDGKFLGQLYVNTPYTDYDKENLVEKSAVQFLNSAKVDVKAGQSADVTITVPTKYLASYDYKKAKTYILDEGDYLFTAANGAHEAANNFLQAKGHSVGEGMDSEAAGKTKTWHLNALDNTTFASDNGVRITNQLDNADLNYYLEDKVTYLSRQDYEGTWPKNYNTDVEVKLADSPKKDEWIKEIRGEQYVLSDSGKTAENPDGVDYGDDYNFDAKNLTYERLSSPENEWWDKMVSQISVNEAIGAVVHGGGQSDKLANIDNPIVGQHEGVNGFVGAYNEYASYDEDGKGVGEPTLTYKTNINSQTLLGTSFNPELAYEWGKIEGEAGLLLKYQSVWGTGLTLRRTPYNGRNYEYISEDPMLTNRIGEMIGKGSLEKGALVGPKHMGFNDQEHNRAGVSAYMNEQKARQTDLRGFEGMLNDAHGLAVMVAFNRVGATNASQSVGMLQGILRNEWDFNGIISTDLASSAYYFNAEGMIMAGVTQVAEFGSNNSNINSKDGHDSKWTYLSPEKCAKDPTLVKQARENLKYQLFAFANSAVCDITIIELTPWWETAINATIITSGILTGLFGAAYIVLNVIPGKKKEDK